MLAVGLYGLIVGDGEAVSIGFFVGGFLISCGCLNALWWRWKHGRIVLEMSSEQLAVWRGRRTLLVVPLSELESIYVDPPFSLLHYLLEAFFIPDPLPRLTIWLRKPSDQSTPSRSTTLGEESFRVRVLIRKSSEIGELNYQIRQAGDELSLDVTGWQVPA